MAGKVRGPFLKAAIAFLGGTAVLISWAEFIFKPIRHYAKLENLTFGETISDLLKIQPSAYDWPFSGYALIISSLLILYISAILIMRPVRAALDFIEGSEAPISILESKIELFMQDKDMGSCLTKREQILHSNSDDVDAYHYSQTASHGTFDKEALKIESFIDRKRVTKEILKSYTGKTLDSIEIFDRKLPTNIIATYFPDNFVLFLYKNFKFFKKSLVMRKCISKDFGEYSVKNPIYQLNSSRYPVSSISVTVSFPKDSVYKSNTIKFFLIMNQAVHELSVTSIDDDANRDKFHIELSKLRQQQGLRIMWENDIP